MISVDTVYKTVLAIINKENSGYIDPNEFNLIANTVQSEIFRGYFEDYNRDKNKENRGLTNSGYGNLPAQDSYRIEQFSSLATLTGTNGDYTLPNDLCFLEDNGITTTVSSSGATGKIVDKADKGSLNYLNCTEAAPTETYPVFEVMGDIIKVTPNTITEIEVRYLRAPKAPKWTFATINGNAMYDPSNASFQDFELHHSEFHNVIRRMLSYCGVNLRETEVVQYAESLKSQKEIHDES